MAKVPAPRCAVWVDGRLMCIVADQEDAFRIVEEYSYYLEREAYWDEWGTR